jgi:FkbM family methyltransferase
MNPFKTVRFILAHPLNRRRPLRALARYANWQVKSRLQSEVEIDWIEGTKLIVRNGMTGATGNIYCGLHEYRDMALVLHALRPGDVFVDVGANIGSYTVLASGVCGALSIAIEPDAGTAQHLARNISANGLESLVDVRQTAAGEGSGPISFTSGLDTMNRVALAADMDIQTVPLARLDDILQGAEPTFIKLDVEGYEIQALRGGEETLAKPSLLAALLETVDDEALAILKRHGFVQLGYDPGSRCLLDDVDSTRGSNALFVRSREAL